MLRDMARQSVARTQLGHGVTELTSEIAVSILKNILTTIDDESKVHEQ